MKIIITDDQIKTEEPMAVPDLTHVFLNALLSATETTVDAAPTEKQQDLKEGLYDYFNDSFSTFLEVLIPDKELRPDLTAEAIYRMENQILQDQLTEVVPINLEVDDQDYPDEIGIGLGEEE